MLNKEEIYEELLKLQEEMEQIKARAYALEKANSDPEQRYAEAMELRERNQRLEEKLKQLEPSLQKLKEEEGNDET